jgi:hypothetical protein
MVAIKEELRTSVGIASPSDAVNNEFPDKPQIVFSDLGEQAANSPYDARAVKLAGTYQLNTIVKPRTTQRQSSGRQVRVEDRDAVYVSWTPAENSRTFDFGIDQPIAITGSSIVDLNAQGFYIPTGQLFSAFEVQSQAPPPASLPQRILRAHFLVDVLAALEKLSTHAGSPSAADYASALFKAMHVFRDTLSADSFAAIIIALHDALAYKNHWADYSAEQYQQVQRLLVKYGNRDLSPDKALKAISAIEALGFDTTPFEIVDEFEEA